MKKAKKKPAMNCDCGDCGKQPVAAVSEMKMFDTVLGIPGAVLTVDGVTLPNLLLKFDSEERCLSAHIIGKPGQISCHSRRLQLRTGMSAEEVFMTIPKAICDLLLKDVCAEYVRAVKESSAKEGNE